MARQRGESVPIGDAFSGMGGSVKAIRKTPPPARLLALCSLPRTNPGNQHRYVRRNGPFTLYMTAGGGNKGFEPQRCEKLL